MNKRQRPATQSLLAALTILILASVAKDHSAKAWTGWSAFRAVEASLER